MHRILAGSRGFIIQIADAAVVSWPEDKKGPKTRQAVPTTALGALGGAFWGLLFGLIFFVLLIGAAVGALGGAIAGSFADFGINDRFINDIRDKVMPGTSALFLMTGSAVADRVVPELKDLNPELITTNLSSEQEARLRELFTAD